MFNNIYKIHIYKGIAKKIQFLQFLQFMLVVNTDKFTIVNYIKCDVIA